MLNATIDRILLAKGLQSGNSAEYYRLLRQHTPTPPRPRAKILPFRR